MSGQHLLCVMNWDLLGKSLYDAKIYGRDHIAYKLYLGLDETSGLPMGIYGNFCYPTEIKNIDFIYQNMLETKSLYPAAVIIDGQNKNLVSEPVMCLELLRGYKRSHTSADTLKRFDEMRLEFMHRKLSYLFGQDNPAHVIVNRITPFDFAAIG